MVLESPPARTVQLNMVRSMCSFNCFAYIGFLCYAVAQAPYKKEGDIMLGGLFSIRQETSEGHCGEITKRVAYAYAMIYAIESINNDSNLLPNISLGYDIRDYCANITNASRITYKMFQETTCTNATQGKTGKRPIVAIIGPTESTTALVISGFLEMLNVSTLSTTTSSALSSHTYKHLYRTMPPDTFLAKAVADIIVHFNWTYVAAIGVDDAYGRYGVWSLIKEAGHKNGSFCVAITEFIPHRGAQSTNTKDIVTKLRRHENIRVIILWMYGAILKDFLREVGRQNLSGRVWILSDIVFSLNVNELSASDSVFMPLYGSIAFQPHDFQDEGFKEYMKALLSNDANKQNLPEWWNDILTLIGNYSAGKHNLTQKGNQQEESCVQNIVNDMYSSYVPFVIDSVYSVAHALGTLTQTINLTDEVQERPNLQKLLSIVNFTGLTGSIIFDDFGDRRYAFYDIINFQKHGAGLKQVIVGKWQPRKGLYLNETSGWNSRTVRFPKSDCMAQCSAGTRKSTTSPCCWQCIPCPRGTINPDPGAQTCAECPRGKRSNDARTACEDLPLVNFHYSSPGGITVLAFAALGMIVTLFSFAVICRFWNTPIVRACNRELSLALLTMITLMLLLAFINLFQPTDTICKIIYPWRYITYNLCLSLLLIKVLCISSAFQVPLVHGYKITSLPGRKQAVVVTTFQAFLLIVLLSWLLRDPPFILEHIYPEHYTFMHCAAYSTLVGKSLFSLTCAYILIKMSFCVFCSFKVRKVPENFSEAKRIAFSMYMFLISLLVYYPVTLSMEGWYVTVVDCVTTLLSAYGFLLCLFLPKIYIILYRPELNTSVNIRQKVTKFSFKSSSLRANPAFDRSIQQDQTRTQLSKDY